MNKPLVSIAITTYNQETFIAQTLDSILMQETFFDYEIVIGEDSGHDKTLAIVTNYKKKFPNKINLLKSDKNHGIELNLLRTIKQCKGKYIAICDGDDYWIDKKKLQKQVAFLEKNSDYGAVATQEKLLINNQLVRTKHHFDESVKTYSFKQILFKNYFTPSTVLFRNHLMVDYINLYKTQDELSFNDYNFFIFFAQKMKFAKLKDVTIVYRVLSESGSRSKDLEKVWNFRKRFYIAIKFYLNHYRINNTIKNNILHYKAQEFYLFASGSGDLDSSNEFLQIFKQKKDYIRFLTLNLIMLNKKWHFFAHFIEKLNIKLKKKLLKNVSNYLE